MKCRLVDIHTHQRHPDILSPTMAGVHPWDAEKGLTLPDVTQCDIVGETGLDFACGVAREAQERLFIAHLTEAERLGKAVVIHCVRAFEPVMRILAEYKLQGVLFHGFIGPDVQAKRCFERGYYLSFGPRSLRSPKTRRVIATAPSELIFSESDDNPSQIVEELYREVAELRHVSLDVLCEQMMKNYEKLILQR